MNVLSDFTIRLNAAVPKSDLDQELSNLSDLLAAKEEKIKKMEDEIKKLRKRRTSVKKQVGGKKQV